MLQSPGGFAETVDAIVGLLRPRFRRVSFVIPVFAKSAATMLALSGNQLVLDELFELGPTDPQFTFPLTGMTSPAKAILDQFERSAEEVEKDSDRLPTWTPILQQYAPSLLPGRTRGSRPLPGHGGELA